MWINFSVTMFAGGESQMMDQLDENLREMKRRVDARVEQMLIVRRAQAPETRALVTSDDRSSDMLEDQSNFDLGAHTRPALPLLRVNDPTTADPEMKLIKPNPNPTSAFSQLQEATTTILAAEQVTPQSLVEIASTFAEYEPNQTVWQEHILAHPPAIRRQSFLHRIFGRLLATRS
jgi:hypothetical protein